jgi:Uncharacterised nucleotidyltransferase
MNRLRLPPLKTIQSALCETTERLAHEVARPTRTQPQWSDFEWHVARAVCAMHGISAVLARALLWQGPAHWSGFLQDQRTQTARRHERIKDLLAAIDERARAAGLALVALKGAELHSIGLYAAGERPMADVDLLIRPDDSERATRALESLGFSETVRSRRHRAFVPKAEHAPAQLGEHADNFLKIELHERVSESLPVRVVDITHRLYPPDAHPGLNAYPSKAALMLHLLLHAAGAVSLRAARLIQLNDLARLSRRMSEADWDQFLALGQGGLRQWWALPPLHLTALYYADIVPSRVLAALSSDCSWLLAHSLRNRTLSDVSLSHTWIDAFPGIEWSQSPLEMLQYMGRRFWPEREMLGLRKQLAQTEISWSHSQWHHSSQARRLLRWIVSRPPRAQTLHTVRAALEHT